MQSIGWYREDIQKLRERILGLIKLVQCSRGSFLGLDYKFMEFIFYFIYLLVFLVLIKFYYVLNSRLDIQDINMIYIKILW